MNGFRNWVSVAALMATASTVAGQDIVQPPLLTWSNYGTAGLVDTPTALSAPDATVAVTMSLADGMQINTLSFQVTERLGGSFRYTTIQDWYSDGRDNPAYNDRSFDIRYRLMDEGQYRPAVTVGLQDLIGTGLFSGEYVVATKHITPRLAFTGGMAWGRLAREDGFANPLGLISNSFDTRAPLDLGEGEGGEFDVDDWFRGDATLFGGLAWKATDQAIVKLEYSPDPQTREEEINQIDVQSPINLGLDYRLNDTMSAGLFYRHGDQIGLMVNATLNVEASPTASGLHGAPAPVRNRGNAPRQGGWEANTAYVTQLRDTLAEVLAADGFRLEATRFEAETVELRINNSRYEYEAEAIGRVARIMTQLLPASVEQFVITPMVGGMPVSRVVLSRSALERLEFETNGAEALLAAARIEDAASPAIPAETVPGVYPRFRWNLRPSISSANVSREDEQARNGFRLFAELSGEANLAPGLALSGNVKQFLVGPDDFDTTLSESVLPSVRSNGSLYAAETDPHLTDLTLSYQFRAAPNTFARLQGGLLEPMFGGAAAEVLWSPVASRLAFGGELAWVKQREFDQLFAFQDYETVTGHLSSYVQLSDQFLLQIDAGRYLAEDWGSTISLTRHFANGWEIGGWATVTDVSAEDFGEGSFDKGIRVEIPFGYFLGQPTRRTQSVAFRPVTRDGGARLDLEDRLYDQVRDYQRGSLEQSWGRVWR